jgi:diguanylate cyclase (GGDEF)-like protein
MTLRQQFSLLTGLLVVILLAGNLLVMVMNGRDYFQQQLNARAYDAATSLALSMSQVAADDEVQLTRLMDVLFDRGFFAEIELQRVDDEPIYRRSRDTPGDLPAPRWFMHWVGLEMIPAEADVTRQWQRLGTVRVVSHSDFAYRDLWAMVRAELIWFSWVLVITLVLLQLLLNWLFRPLVRVERQALAICERQWQVQAEIPRPRELRRMVLAMNKMVQKLQSIFTEQSAMTEQLRAESFNDNVSGLLNRRGFDQRLQHILQRGEEHSGVLLLLQLQNLSELNQSQGRQLVDDVLHMLGAGLQRCLQEYPAAFTGRRSGSDFALYIPCADQAQADALLQQMFSQLATSVLSRRKELIFHLGGVFLQGVQDDPVQALSCADAALRQAQRSPEGRAQLYRSDSSSGIQEWTAGEWRELLTGVLEAGALQLQFLPVISNRNRRLLQFEVFSRIVWQGETLSAARFWPMVEQHQLAARYDASIVAQVLALLEQHAPQKGIRYCINISPASVLDEQFHQWLVELFRASPALAAHIALEVPESSLTGIETALARLAIQLKPFGVTLGVDQVGTGSMAFAYLQRLPLDYIRIDGSFNRGLHQAQDHRFFIQSMVQIAHNLDLLILGEGIEEADDVSVLRQTGVDGMSGYFFSKPLATLEDAHAWQLPADDD